MVWKFTFILVMNKLLSDQEQKEKNTKRLKTCAVALTCTFNVTQGLIINTKFANLRPYFKLIPQF